MGDDLMTREWLPVPIPGYDAYYEVSNDGLIRSLSRGRTRGRVMKTPIDKQGYQVLGLSLNSVRLTVKVHRLVTAAFIGPCPPGQEVRHLNGVRSDSRLENLAYGTRSENAFDAVRHGTHTQASKTHCPAGHPYDEESMRADRTERRCKPCSRAQDSRRRARLKIGRAS